MWRSEGNRGSGSEESFCIMGGWALGLVVSACNEIEVEWAGWLAGCIMGKGTLRSAHTNPQGHGIAGRVVVWAIASYLRRVRRTQDSGMHELAFQSTFD